MADQHETTTLGGGCFWCLEAVYQQLRGVDKVESGYAGGHVKHPSYQAVCMGVTGHAEVVQITFDPDEISFRDILDVFFTIHDPTTLNRQGPDAGTQYRSAIFYESDEQRATAEATIAEISASKLWGDDPIVTQVEPLDTFYRAESYHQNYYVTNPDQPYCRAIIEPKVAKTRKHFLEKLRR